MTTVQEKSVLHIEDHPEFRELCRIFLTNNGYTRIVHVTNLEDAYAEIRKGPYDLYVIDGRFPRNRNSQPEFLWSDLCNFLTRCYDSPRIILLSAEKTLRLDAEKRGITYLDKVDPDLSQKLR